MYLPSSSFFFPLALPRMHPACTRHDRVSRSPQLAAALNHNVSMVCAEALALPYDNGDFADLHAARRLISEIHAPHALASALHQTPWPLGSDYQAHASAWGNTSQLDAGGCRLSQVHSARAKFARERMQPRTAAVCCHVSRAASHVTINPGRRWRMGCRWHVPCAFRRAFGSRAMPRRHTAAHCVQQQSHAQPERVCAVISARVSQHV